MKSTFLLFFLFFIGATVVAQNGISFQGIARDPQGNAITGQTISVKFTIGSFSETQNISTDNFGVFSTTIGSVNTADFNNLVFANMTDNLKVEVDGTIIYDDKFNTVPYAKSAENGVPPGSIMPFAGPKSNIPAGWLYCNGTSFASTGMYGKLYAAIGYAWGNNGGNFRVPDLRGYFLRGAADGVSIDPNRATRIAKYGGGNTGDNVGTYQSDTYNNHNHSGTVTGAGTHNHYLGSRGFETNGAKGADGSHDDNGITTNSGGGGHVHGVTINNSTSGGSETRPENASVIFIIKY
ncbi:MAG: hypothetical protein GQ525_08400 [Draconibacterium sp.]|nr:hypothetical protein [Draconibacterium sp.]